MTVISAPEQFNTDDLYVDLAGSLGRSLYLKCEGFNFAGSVKLKAALGMVTAAERSGRLTPWSVLVESSSGNLGVALAMIAASRGYRFVCVTDPRCNPATHRIMEALGAEVRVVDLPDAAGGYLATRLSLVRSMVESDDRYVWLDQYANPENWGSHLTSTGPQIESAFPGIDVLFVGAGTTGTLMGCARYFRSRPGRVRVVAVDAVGSITFGDRPAPRMIPGLGTSVRPPLLDEAYVDDVVHVAEPDTLEICHRLARRGFLFGGSTGTVVAGALAWLSRHGDESVTAVALAPDLGERYLDTVYRTSWLREHFGERISAGAGSAQPQPAWAGTGAGPGALDGAMPMGTF
ncbi:Ornithine cyclodeaminase [Pseudonocardia sp. Ae168_Ps1]|uniref:2,3-diaminopropionate biosynthesis protein SbnA n=1 Tax=unclassified Pseudonocardia TaxID=2619320 RepID=UPI0006CB5FB9|nr:MULTISPECIES: 2,3-diaminopropionate biosynthesis protein SbnA [unclassified Pseudonocardia]ALE73103.1 cysteine synthase [Pseudonocardia sp. EC080625-04]ALL76422.1 cysteine synthase [Pseudonocardia sp. EC080610-09]ALL83449.1 cysteine synthase [Pseudonocardia sp. EC080619-01]OLL72732.1 Ornithine cyclodeaminase [Pseudonocardia sp. Ae150A_Ps1]OLL78704.1 Ornithine cyclodeaminase [Pseudonocardia sp. Ae168_Ps1]